MNVVNARTVWNAESNPQVNNEFSRPPVRNYTFVKWGRVGVNLSRARRLAASTLRQLLRSITTVWRWRIPLLRGTIPRPTPIRLLTIIFARPCLRVAQAVRLHLQFRLCLKPGTLSIAILPSQLITCVAPLISPPALMVKVRIYSGRRTIPSLRAPQWLQRVMITNKSSALQSLEFKPADVPRKPPANKAHCGYFIYQLHAPLPYSFAATKTKTNVHNLIVTATLLPFLEARFSRHSHKIPEPNDNDSMFISPLTMTHRNKASHSRNDFDIYYARLSGSDRDRFVRIPCNQGVVE